MFEIREGDIYKHFKGGEYIIICLAKDSETQEDVVVYQNIKDDSDNWVRKLSNFVENVDRDNYKGPRFKKVIIEIKRN